MGRGDPLPLKPAQPPLHQPDRRIFPTTRKANHWQSEKQAPGLPGHGAGGVTPLRKKPGGGEVPPTPPPPLVQNGGGPGGNNPDFSGDDSGKSPAGHSLAAVVRKELADMPQDIKSV